MNRRWLNTVSLFCIVSSSRLVAQSQDWSLAEAVPPSWQMGTAAGSSDQDDASLQTNGLAPKKRRRSDQQVSHQRPWYEPRFALGMGVDVPELLPIEGYAFFGRYFALRAFVTPSLPIPIRVQMPSDVIATTQGALAVANPAFTINGKLNYGPQYGLEALAFPFGGSFFIGAGASYRKVHLVADAKSSVLVCSLIEAAKPDPCSDPTAAIETRTELTAHADLTTEAILMRGSVGWFWDVGSWGYFMFDVGATKPTQVHRNASVTVGLATPENANEAITGALGEVRDQQQSNLSQQASAAISPYDQKILPILGLSAGVRF